MKRRVQPEYRILLSEKIMELGNLALASLAFGHLISGQSLSFILLLSGVFLMAMCYLGSYIINRYRR